LDALWINHPNRSADSAYKPLQLAVAARCGLTTAATVITNSPDAVRRCAIASPTGVVRKSLGPNSVTEGNALTVAFTHRLTPADLADLSGVDATATQVQHWVNKIYEALTASAIPTSSPSMWSPTWSSWPGSGWPVSATSPPW
jgi:hypothetical protein